MTAIPVATHSHDRLVRGGAWALAVVRAFVGELREI